MDERTDEDAALMLRVAAGDTAAFAAIYDRHHRSVARFAHRFVQDAGKAEELTQDIFVKLYRHAGRYRATARFKTFLFRVAANHCLNEVRRGEYRVTHVPEHDEEGRSVEVPAPDAHAPDRAVEGRELEATVAAALQQLSERERTAFSLCRFEGMSYRDIAEVLSASEAAVKSLIHRATLSVARAVEAWQAGARSPARSEA
ncbi:MAG TPA: sigma-70 family RNA polymerase sigma factor [Myxococcaceae bacterium]|nr:sigma-70 family RNA polymerase sigma factor [Myxococcaceae bacterium]